MSSPLSKLVTNFKRINCAWCFKIPELHYLDKTWQLLLLEDFFARNKFHTQILSSHKNITEPVRVWSVCIFTQLWSWSWRKNSLHLSSKLNGDWFMFRRWSTCLQRKMSKQCIINILFKVTVFILIYAKVLCDLFKFVEIKIIFLHGLIISPFI